MAQFDVYANRDSETKGTFPYFVNVQNNLLDGLNRRVVVPLGFLDKIGGVFPLSLCPVIDYDGQSLVLLTHQITSVAASFLSRHSPASEEFSKDPSRNQIVAALDFLVTGIWVCCVCSGMQGWCYNSLVFVD